jgi:ribA/ribD-fused uncharacterized protein
MIKEFQGEYRWLSNFVKCEINFDNFKFQSVEHAYQSTKSDDIEWKSFCSNSKTTSGEVKKASHKITIVKNWKEIRYEIMKQLLNQKFSQEPFKTLLKNTGTEYIQEGNYWNDVYWGFCLKKNIGENNLGKLIMSIRDEFDSIKLIVAGSREFDDYMLMKELLSNFKDNLGTNFEIVSGTANGADKLGEKFATDFDINLKQFPVNWNLGKQAGYIRNEEMAKYATSCLIFWDGMSKGTKHMINLAIKYELNLTIVCYNIDMIYPKKFDKYYLIDY